MLPPHPHIFWGLKIGSQRIIPSAKRCKNLDNDLYEVYISVLRLLFLSWPWNSPDWLIGWFMFNIFHSSAFWASLVVTKCLEYVLYSVLKGKQGSEYTVVGTLVPFGLITRWQDQHKGKSAKREVVSKPAASSSSHQLFFFSFSRATPRHLEIPRLGIYQLSIQGWGVALGPTLACGPFLCMKSYWTIIPISLQIVCGCFFITLQLSSCGRYNTNCQI